MKALANRIAAIREVANGRTAPFTFIRVNCAVASVTRHEKASASQRDSNPLLKFRCVAQFQHKHARDCALERKMQIGQFARIAQNNAVQLSEFVRKASADLFGVFLFAREPVLALRFRTVW